ncbi:SusC/RagA family TonB-linked outer membrane protein [Pedobacter africanus]|uniref:TonB-linked SusC/RagA family outer membrane protein n=1 Tax=Pedobacter africanus TaxID=151894 RepID=A0ACC6KW27_9SPHI|nr:SusC/RagA family TonB-linked outer membrane protein [Pedobacter africanus]MDR6783338.1 TonB-linked SusC/RagA family outer membrane protein [Pedobacter africanus]
MRLAAVILIASLMQVSAATFGQHINLTQRNVSLDNVLKEIRKQSGYDILYNSNSIAKHQKLNVDVKNLTIEQALTVILKGLPLTFEINNKDVTIKSKERSSFLDKVTAYFANIEVRGRVVNEEGKPVEGATIAVKGSSMTTFTSSSGEFVLKGIAENAILEIRYIGYETREIKAAPDLTITLLQSSAKLNEIEVNAGYYTVKDRERTGNIAKISSKEIQNQPVNNVLSAVQGRMSGVSITQNSGVPGGGYSIQIRGRNSVRTYANSEIDGSQPLYLVDGIPIGSGMTTTYGGNILSDANLNPLSNISPNDIESIEILKDADATAIYGSRGANGVVLVTTKKAKKGILGLTLNSSYALNNSLTNLEMMNTDQYIAMRKQAYANDGISVYPATAYDINGVWDQNRYTDWNKAILGNTAVTSNVQLSLSGGGENTSFLVSYGHNEQTTVFAKDFQYKTNTILGNIGHRSVDNRFNFNMSTLFSKLEHDVINLDNTSSALSLSPNAPALYDDAGNINWQNNTFDNPLAAYNSTYSNNNIQFMNNFRAGYELLQNLQIKLNGGVNYQTFDELSLQPSTIYNPSLGVGPASSRALQSNKSRFSYTLEPQVNWDLKKDRHQLDVLIGGSYQSDLNTQGAIQGYGFTNNAFIQNISAATTKLISDQIRTEYKYAAIFGRVNYQFDHRFIINFTGRRDGSSRFGSNRKFANFGAIGAAWLFSNEGFLKKLSWLSFGKLRASYGSSGTDNIGNYQYNDTFITSTLGYNNITGLVPSKLFNPNFSWEKTIKMESALELGFFKERLNVATSFYHNRSSNQLVGYQLPSVTGFTSVLANLDATIQNTGWEFDLVGRPLIGALKWEMSFNLSIPRNKLLSFPGLEGSTYSNSYVVGESVNILKLYHLEGINPQSKQYVFTDFNGDGKISSSDDRQIVKNIGVNYFGGWNNNFSYENWTFSFLLQFVKQQSRNFNYLMSSPGLMRNLPVEALDVWSPENPGGTYMPYHTTASPLHSLFQMSDTSVSDGSFIRLKNVQVTYRIPLKGKVIKDPKIYFQGQNLYTWTRYFGLDPEFTSIGFLPPLKTYSFGMQINF